MSAVAIAADIVVVVALVITTFGVAGLFRLDDLYMQLHAAAKAVGFGVALLMLASVATADGAIVGKAVLVALFLLATTPVGAHAIARAERRTEDGTPDRD